MTTETLERDTIVSQPSREIVYAAVREDLRLVQIAEHPILNGQGIRIGTHPHRTFAFRNGLFRIGLEGTVETEHGVEVPVEEVLPWFEKHKLNGSRTDGFFKVEIAVPPVTPEENKKLMRLGMSFDRDAIMDVMEIERNGYNRAEVLEAAQEALDNIDRMETEARERVEAEAKPKKA